MVFNPNKLFQLVFANQCAWRAVYAYWKGQKFFHLGINPTSGYGPRLLGRWRLNLPHIFQQQLLHAIDGGY